MENNNLLGKKEKILTQCFELANLRTLREKCKLKNKEPGARRYDSLIDFGIKRLKEMLNEEA